MRTVEKRADEIKVGDVIHYYNDDVVTLIRIEPFPPGLRFYHSDGSDDTWDDFELLRVVVPEIELTNEQAAKLLNEVNNPIQLITPASHDVTLTGELGEKVAEFREIVEGASLTIPEVRRDLKALLDEIEALVLVYERD